MRRTVLRARADGRVGNGDRIGRSKVGGGSTTVPRLWTPDDEYREPSMMIGTAMGVTDEERSPSLLLPDGSPVPRRRVGFRPPGES